MFRTGPWPRDKIPQIIQVYLKAFQKMNPRVHQVYLDDDDAESFILNYFPEYIRGYKSIIPGAYRAYVLRLCLLLTHGGYYNDIGHLHKCPLGEKLSREGQLSLETQRRAVDVYRSYFSTGLASRKARSTPGRLTVPRVGQIGRSQPHYREEDRPLMEEEWEATSPYRENLIQNILGQNEDASRMDAANSVERSRSPPRVRTVSIRDFFS